jgi:DNA-binding response OmpR family regulator
MFDRVDEFGGRVNVQRKVLVVEDDRLIAMELEERLVEFGHAVLGPAHTIEEAEALLAGERPDGALLDANVGGQSSVALGVKLAELGVPVAFCTGYDEIKNTPPILANAQVLTKPISDAQLQAGLNKLLG